MTESLASKLSQSCGFEMSATLSSSVSRFVLGTVMVLAKRESLPRTRHDGDARIIPIRPLDDSTVPVRTEAQSGRVICLRPGPEYVWGGEA